MILDLYTCDVEFANLPIDPVQPKPGKRDAKLKRVKARLARDKYREMAFAG